METAATTLLAATLASAQAAPAASFVYRGLCDASAAVALGPEHFVVADDETNVLHVYRRSQADQVATHDLSAFLGIKPGKEADLEGAAVIGTRIYWISSHGRNSAGKVQERRYRFFATDIVAGAPPSLRPHGQPYTRLLDDLTAAPALAAYRLAEAAALPPKAAGGLNIEGLSATPDGRLLIGFRSPVPNGRALLVPIENPAEVVQGRPARIGRAIELDLGGGGIRSIDLVGDNYLIVAGPDAEDGHFSLFRWSGKVGEAAAALPQIDLKGLQPEVVFEIPGSGQVQILSDDGTVLENGVACKDRPPAARSFRSVVVTLPQR